MLKYVKGKRLKPTYLNELCVLIYFTMIYQYIFNNNFKINIFIE